MKYVLFFASLACLSERSNVNCGITDLPSRFFSRAWGSGPQEPVPSEMGLILAVETSGHCYLSNNQFITNKMNPIYSEFLFICPPESSEDRRLNENSRTKNALFIKEIHKNPRHWGDPYELIEHKCKHQIMPSIINIDHDPDDPEVELYIVGYEVFLGEGLTSCKADFYESAQIRDERFAWFHVYTIAFNPQKHNVVSVFSHSLAYRNDRRQLYMETHQDYMLGMKLFHENNSIPSMSSIYNNKPYQRGLVEKLFEGATTPFSYVDSNQKRFLSGIHLAPLDSFGIPLLRQAGQTYGNIAPMWGMVYNDSWFNVEVNLEILTQGVNAISVITGVYGTLQLSGRKIYLGPDETVQVPAAFYKIVSYSPNESDKYNMVIVTSNNPYDEKDRVNNRICEKNQCKQFGWEYVEQDLFRMGRTTCCELTKQVLAKLKMKSYESLVDKTLDLTKVPHWRNVKLTLDVKQYIVNQFYGVETDKPADDDMYKSDIRLTVPNEDDEEKLGRFVSILYKNYVQPYFSSIRTGIEIVVESPSG